MTHSWVAMLGLCVACTSAATSSTFSSSHNNISSSMGDTTDAFSSSGDHPSSSSSNEEPSSTSDDTSAPDEGIIKNPPSTCISLSKEDLEALQALAKNASDWDPTLTAENICNDLAVTCGVIEYKCRVVELDLSSKGLKSIPPNMAQLSKLRTLNLSYNELGQLPTNFGHTWIHLQILYLDGNQITHLPANFGAAWLHLQKLSLARNQLNLLPADFGAAWSHLQVLFLNENDLTELPENFGSAWTQLKMLLLFKNKLSQIPLNFGNTWTHLEGLFLFENDFEQLPENFGSMWLNLQLLELSSNRLSQLPIGFGNTWINLDWLVLSYNRLSHLPPDFGHTWTKIHTLSLYANQLRGEVTNMVPQNLLNQASQEDFDFCLSYNALDVESPSLKTLLHWNLNCFHHDGEVFSQSQTLPPQVFAAQSITNNSMTLSWKPQVLNPLPKPTLKDVSIGGYVITVEGLSPIVLENMDQTSYQLTDLKPNTIYRLHIQAFTNPHIRNPNKVFSMPSPSIEVSTLP